jgi:hypothetical protein
MNRGKTCTVVVILGLLLAACGPISHTDAPAATTHVSSPGTTTQGPTSTIGDQYDVDLSDVDAALADLDRLTGDLDSSLTRDEGDVAP